jgi:hypothetical protein
VDDEPYLILGLPEARGKGFAGIESDWLQNRIGVFQDDLITEVLAPSVAGGSLDHAGRDGAELVHEFVPFHRQRSSCLPSRIVRIVWEQLVKPVEPSFVLAHFLFDLLGRGFAFAGHADS